MKLANKEYTYLVNFLEDAYDLVEYRLTTESATIIDWTSAGVYDLGNGYFAVNLSLGLFKGVIEWRGQLGGVYVDFAKEEVNTNEDFTLTVDDTNTKVGAIDTEIGLIATELGTIDGKIDTLQTSANTIITDIGIVDAEVGAIADKVVLMREDVAVIKKVETGNWRVINGQAIFYDADDVEFLRFNLLKTDGTQGTALTTTQRVRVA